jgi:hypothetical protein
MPQQNELPLFDPAWDYAIIYERTNKATNDAIILLNHMADVEYATRETDLLLTEALGAIASHLNSISELIKGEGDI